MTFRTFIRLAAQTQLLPVLESGEETLVGGQAVMEGVMMRAPHSYCVAVRRANGELVTEENPLARVSEKYPIFKYPVLRGVGTLGQAMWLGVKSLNFSTRIAVADEAAKEGKTTEEGKELPGWMMTANLIFSFAFFVVLYKFVPLWLTERVQAVYPAVQNQILFNLVDGLIRIAIFLTFLYALSRYKDIRRLFEFHGAEHKVVYNFESRTPVTTENAQAFSTLHPRCGTSFLLVVMVISMILYMFLPVSGFVEKMIVRVLCIPLVAGLSYELIRFAARKRGSLLALMTAPGLWLQKITTQPPDNAQVDVAIHALNGAMALEKEQGGELVIA
ncbi:MAG: DUF1385 domain-containing protein [Acidobacteria bacterium]|nr:DUF1385 domain-containing protein [Acidobacteriota bacterium]